MNMTKNDKHVVSVTRREIERERERKYGNMKMKTHTEHVICFNENLLSCKMFLALWLHDDFTFERR